MPALAASLITLPSLSWAPGPGVTVDGVFRAADGKAVHRAVTFDTRAVPSGGKVTVTERVGRDGRTRVELRVHGVEANRTFGAHVHQKPCGTAPDDSGAHYQNAVDPKQPSTDPAYANPRNEVWLDLTSDRQGDGASTATVAWRFRAGEARSVVIHEHATETGPGVAGTAGGRLACVNVPFK
ncbi:superoxide dismutase family protein [Streptomyces sp. AV19]|uniref:superoxide dismutase family protein n=1 Tax=Streptomyces sp. AV19 TaxID=2793068 RepID=UPI0018FE3CF1|nr:superoxide dismutase family protein [Streptomyces sp. AV19]MBH1935245.1 superoxide dismutase family protein [Streptomyces sp. AV19]MDG4532061.1 superoxide dismutase family protein [Streptomyces sp. AV19]